MLASFEPELVATPTAAFLPPSKRSTSLSPALI